MTSYVYDKWNQVTCILGANNFATKFEYDSEGRLKKTYVEVIDDSVIPKTANILYICSELSVQSSVYAEL